jgi:hypothetical protein
VKAITTIIYKPIGIVMGILAGMVGKRIFDFVWGKIDDEDPPKPNTKEVPLAKIVGAAALQGVIFKVTRSLVDRQTAKGFYYLTGAWPGERRPEAE